MSISSNGGCVVASNQALPQQNYPTDSKPFSSLKLQSGYSWRSLFRGHTALKIGALAATTIIMGTGCMMLCRGRESGVKDTDKLNEKLGKDVLAQQNAQQDSIGDQKLSFEICKKNMNEILLSQGKESFTSKLIDTIGGLESYCKLPELPWSDSFISVPMSTYIDNIREKDTTASVMRLIDSYGRPGIMLRTCEEEDSRQIFDRDDISFTCNSTRKSIETIFQRYTSAPYRWACGHLHGNCHISNYLNTVPSINSEQELNTLKTLIADRKITLKKNGKEFVVRLD